jgi:hypothetical protein
MEKHSADKIFLDYEKEAAKFCEETYKKRKGSDQEPGFRL